MLPVLHADEHILVLDKPSGLLTVPGKPAEHADCLERRAREVYPEARIIHRLDMDTSGVIVLALTAHAHRHIGLQFEKRQTQKLYQALVWGQIQLRLPLAMKTQISESEVNLSKRGQPRIEGAVLAQF